MHQTSLRTLTVHRNALIAGLALAVASLGATAQTSPAAPVVTAPAPATAPAGWTKATTVKISQHQQSQFTRARGPGTSLSPSSVDLPLVML